MASSTYYIRIIKARYTRKEVILYIEVIPTGAIDRYTFPYVEELKVFFLSALSKIYSFDIFPKKKVLDLELPLNQKAENTDFIKPIKDYLFVNGTLEYKPFKDLNVEIYDIDESLTPKYIKQVTPYDNSHDKLMELLKRTKFEQENENQEKEKEKDDDNYKLCLHCGKSFKCAKKLTMEKLIARAKHCTKVYNSEENPIQNSQLIKDYLKNKVSISMKSTDILSMMNEVKEEEKEKNPYDDHRYTYSQHCTDALYFDSPQEIIYYCCSIRFCSTLCASEDLKSKSWEEVFDGYDIYHTYIANYYKVDLYKKYVDKDAIKNLINKTYSTYA